MAKQQGDDPYFLLTDEAALAGPGAEGLFFLPYLTGERTPHFDPDAKGAWIGLTVRHGRPHMIRSVLEGATFAMRDSLELIREMGVTIEQVRVSGGGAATRSGGRSRPTSTAATCTRSTRPRGRPSASPCWPRSARAGSPRSPRRATPRSGSSRPRRVDPRARPFYDRAYADLSSALPGPAGLVQGDRRAGRAVEAAERSR